MATPIEMDKFMDHRLHVFSDKTKTPLGELILLADESGNLRAIEWADHEDRIVGSLSRRHRSMQITSEARRNPFGLTAALDAYFAGEIESIQSLPVLTTGTPFQQSVWKALRAIPAGQTTSYGSLAKKLGVPAATRAVGLANGANPVSIVVPCHRVIGANGSLTGYGGGLHRKRWLLEHEQRSSSLIGQSHSSSSEPAVPATPVSGEQRVFVTLELPFADVIPDSEPTNHARSKSSLLNRR
jgi:methylated-DNA-[protein]-cysteine S-methyltransferase